jgi:3-isopropylmalate dehydrogenase
VRENSEGFQPDRNVVAGCGEFRPTEDVTISVRVITRAGSSRVARAAFEIARTRSKRLTTMHKNTVFKLGCGMFVEECYRVATEFPDVALDEVIVDTFAMRLVRDPQSFDVVVTTNMFGDILTDEGGGAGRRRRHGAWSVHRRGQHRDGARQPTARPPISPERASQTPMP